METFFTNGAHKLFQVLLKLAEEMKAPISFAATVVIMIVVAWLAGDHVSKKDVEDIKMAISNNNARLEARILGVENRLAFDHLDTRKHTVRTEIFNLQQHMRETGKSDRLEEERLSELNGEKEDLDRQMSAFHF